MREGGKFMDVARRAAWEAGRMLKENVDKSREITFKSVLDLVTDCDSLSQRMIVDRLAEAFPDHGILAEEGVFQRTDSEYRWIIDPLDGTTNFAHRFPFFCVSIALEYQGDLRMGVVYDPMREEMFTAVAGRGARLNGGRIQVSRIGNLDRSLLATGFPYDIRESKINNIRHFYNFVMRAQAVRRCGSAAIDICYVACGRFDGFWELKLKPWDVAAAALIVREAGGAVSDFKNGPFSAYHHEVVATNGLIHKAMLKVLSLNSKPAGISRKSRRLRAQLAETP